MRIFFGIVMLILSTASQAGTCSSDLIFDYINKMEISASSKEKIEKTFRNYKYFGYAVPTKDKSIILVSNTGWSAGKEFRSIGVFQIKNDNAYKLGELKSSERYDSDCLVINGNEARLRTDYYKDTSPRLESFDITRYLPEFAVEMKEMLTVAASQNSITALNAFITKYEPDSVLDETGAILSQAKMLRKDLIEQVYESEYQVAKKTKKVSSLHSYIKEHPKTTKKNEAIVDIYELVKTENNIIGYKWFLDNYPNSKKSRDALKSLHKLAFQIADDIGTIDAYNDFVIAYPIAEQVKKANEEAYALERKTYSSYLTSNEKLSRALLVRSKQLERKARDVNSDQRTGYMLVINRMNELLQDEFPAEDATLRYLESEEFKSFYKDLKRILTRIDRNIADIRSNTANLSSLIKDQTRLMDDHFEKTAESREMSAKLTEQHRYWERYLKK